MFKRTISLAAAIVLCLTVSLAAADSYTQYSSVRAVSNQRLATRTGPGTRYDEPGSFNKGGYEYKILSKAYDGNIWWLQVEIRTGNGVIWAYTGLKRFDNVRLNAIPEERVIGRCRTSERLTGYYAPTRDASIIKRPVPANVECAIYGYYYGGDGSDFIQIEFYDTGLQQYRRAWVPDTFVDDYEMYYGF